MRVPIRDPKRAPLPAPPRRPAKSESADESTDDSEPTISGGRALRATGDAGSSPGLPRVLLLNGPNLGRLGVREPEIYGSASFADLCDAATQWGAEFGLDVEVRQTDDEAELVGWLHGAADIGAHVVLNPAAFTHYSYALRDAAAPIPQAGLKLIEVHLSNPHIREDFRHYSTVSGVATGTIAGFGFDSYRLALQAISEQN